MTSVTEDRRRGTSPASIPEPTGEIHEAAAVFPMLPEDELQELAEDIKANGLLDPIVLDHDGALVDGRNRLAACRIAGVEPRYTSLNGHDPVTYILSKNVARRNLTKGQRAMAAARMRLLSKQATREVAESSAVSASRVAQASTVIQHAPDLADAVMAGTMPLNAAYDEARQRKAEAETREERAKRDERNLAMLRVSAPDLADLVAEERMALGEAMGAYETDREMMRRMLAARTRRTRYTEAIHQAARKIREERRPRLSTKPLPEGV